MALDFHKIKERKDAVLNLKKQTNLNSQKAQVVLALDFSGSMGGLYANGTVQDTVERILPFGLAFDDNGEVDTYIFENHYIKLPENITLKNLDGYVNNKIIGKYNMGGTCYSPVLNAIYNDFANIKKGGLLGFGKSTVEKMNDPVYVIFITDGDNFDRPETEEVITKMSNSGFFIQFLGVGNESFNFLSKLDDLKGRAIDNVNFFKVPNLKNITDEELYKLLMTEFPGWTTQARTAGFIN